MKQIYRNVLNQFSFRCIGITAVIAVCGVFLSCASNPFAVSKPAFVPEDFFGISPDRSPLDKEDFDLLDDFNAVWIRTTIHWSNVEQEEGKWDFDHWDTYIAKAEAAGKKVIFILGFDNEWLYDNGKEHRDLTEREIPYFLKYVEQVVSRYRTRVIYEIWNEPNVIFWKGSSEHFFALSAATAEKIREVEPGAVILAGSTFRVFKKFTRGMFISGAMEHADGFSVHPYAISPHGTVKQIITLQKILDEFDYKKPVWITEVGYFTGPAGLGNIKRYPEYIVKTLSSLAVRAGEIQHLIWYEFMDNYNPGEVSNPLNPLNYLGLIYPDRTLKNGAEAFMLTAGYLAGAEHRPEFPLRKGINKGIISLYFIKQDGTSILILWKNGSGKQNLRLAVPGTVNIFNHSIYNREIVTLQAESILEITREPVFITWTGGGPPRLTNK